MAQADPAVASESVATATIALSVVCAVLSAIGVITGAQWPQLFLDLFKDVK